MILEEYSCWFNKLDSWDLFITLTLDRSLSNARMSNEVKFYNKRAPKVLCSHMNTITAIDRQRDSKKLHAHILASINKEEWKSYDFKTLIHKFHKAFYERWVKVNGSVWIVINPAFLGEVKTNILKMGINSQVKRTSRLLTSKELDHLDFNNACGYVTHLHEVEDIKQYCSRKRACRGGCNVTM